MIGVTLCLNIWDFEGKALLLQLLSEKYSQRDRYLGMRSYTQVPVPLTTYFFKVKMQISFPKICRYKKLYLHLQKNYMICQRY